MIPNKVSYPMTPYQLVTHSKPFLPKCYFGQTGVFHFKRKDTPEIRSEWGIFIGYGESSNYLRAYIPIRKLVYSRRTFKPNPNYPPEWNLQKRLKNLTTSIPTTITTSITNSPATSTIPPQIVSHREGVKVPLIPNVLNKQPSIQQQQLSQLPIKIPIIPETSKFGYYRFN
jgi:hypothetical protein